MLRNIIDSEHLIEEVKKRPVLYDSRLPGNSDPNLRRANWEEITKEVFQDVWQTSNNTERDALVKEIQVKWKSLRDAYARVKKQEKDDLQKGLIRGRKKYIFYDRLSFLEGFCKSIQSPNAIYIQEEKTQDSLDQINSDSPVFFKTDEDMYEPNEQVTNDRTDDRLTTILSELVKLEKDERVEDKMGNRRFLLSLLPFMEKLPDDVNLEVRLQLMSILQTYSSGDSLLKS